jgi:hypothetical protein
MEKAPPWIASYSGGSSRWWQIKFIAAAGGVAIMYRGGGFDDGMAL